MRGEGAGQQLGFNVQGRGSAADWGQGTRGGAHIEHEGHARDAGGVEAQRLVERKRGLPRVEKTGMRCGARVCGSADGGDGVQRAVEARLQTGGSTGVERTWNMEPISMLCVTPEVSKLSGWLNADAYCRESKGGHTVLGKVRAGRREAAGDRGGTQRAGEGATVDWGQGTARSAP